jgi:N-acetylmuramoyl-L-alanine amidase
LWLTTGTLASSARPHMPLPKTVHSGFRDLVSVYKRTPIEFPHLKRVSTAQWALESGWGKSNLAIDHYNFGGAKWRSYMKPYGWAVSYEAHDGEVEYCHFQTFEKWIAGYWARFDLEPAYKGWRKHTGTGDQFIRYIGPTWVGTGEAKYVRDVLRISKQIADIFEDPSHVQETGTAGNAGSGSDWGRVRPDSDFRRT